MSLLHEPEGYFKIPMPLGETQELKGPFTGKVVEISNKRCIIDFENGKMGYLPISHLNFGINPEYYLGKFLKVKVKWIPELDIFRCSRKCFIYKAFEKVKKTQKGFWCTRLLGEVFWVYEDESALIDIGEGYLIRLSADELEGIHLTKGELRNDFLLLPTEDESFMVTLKRSNHIGDIVPCEVDQIDEQKILCNIPFWGYSAELMRTHSNLLLKKGDTAAAYVIGYNNNNFLELVLI